MPNGSSKKNSPTLEARHRPSGLNSQFHGGQPDFSAYIADTRRMLSEARSRLETGDALKLSVEVNAPFELVAVGQPAGREKPYRRGVLLIHGLTDSPYFMRPLAEFFQEQGFRVMAILLPGHGTRPGDLLDVGWPEWAHAVSYGIEQLDEEADEIFLAGLSVGGALGILLGQQDPRVRGLMLFSPALRITERAARAYLHKAYSWLYPPARWVSIMPDRDPHKYESLPMNAAFQTYRLTQAVQAGLDRDPLRLPVFAAASEDDVSVDSSATLELVARLPHPANRLVWYTREPSRLPAGIVKDRLEMVNSVIPEQNILSFSHLSLMLPPEDAYYGARGSYSNCLHYFPRDMEKYTACSRNSPPVLQGEITEQNLRAGVMRRLTYNPHFAALKASLQRFLESLP